MNTSHSFLYDTVLGLPSIATNHPSAIEVQDVFTASVATKFDLEFFRRINQPPKESETANLPK